MLNPRWRRRVSTTQLTWRALNDELMTLNDPAQALALLQAERKGQRRKKWLERIYGRFSHLRRKLEEKQYGL